MEDAPLNLAHFYERKANKFLKHNRFEEAIECLQISLDYIEEAYKTVQMPKAIEVLVVQEEEYKRQIRQMRYKKAYYDCRNKAEDNCKEPTQNEEQGELNQKSNELVLGSSKPSKDISPYKTMGSFNESTDANEYKIYEDERRLLNLDFRITEIPNLAPLELPNFDFQIFQCNAAGGISSDKKD